MLIKETGIPTFARPHGIPDNYRVKISREGAGIKYVHPTNDQIFIRVMLARIHSKNPFQRENYIAWHKDGKRLDKYGNSVKKKSKEAHIPIDEFITYKE